MTRPDNDTGLMALVEAHEDWPSLQRYGQAAARAMVADPTVETVRTVRGRGVGMAFLRPILLDVARRSDDVAVKAHVGRLLAALRETPVGELADFSHPPFDTNEERRGER